MNLHEFLANYNNHHKCCPKCGGKYYSVKLDGYIVDPEHLEKYRDENNVHCFDCGWEGVVHNLVPDKDGRIQDKSF